jgi:hypothetical protein
MKCAAHGTYTADSCAMCLRELGAASEREKIVAWLRKKGTAAGGGPVTAHYDLLAELIEEGAHYLADS